VGDGVVMFVPACVIALALVVSTGPLPTAGLSVQAEVSDADKGAPVFSLAVGQCLKPKGTPKDAPPECAVVVQGKKGVSGRHKLEWQVRSGRIERPNANSFVVVAADDEEHRTTIRWAPVTVGNVNLKSGVRGLRVMQEERRGDRIRRRYDVFLVRGGALKHDFTAQEGRGGRTWSTLEAVDIDHDGGNELVFFTSTTPDDAQADRFEMQIYAWRADVKKMVARNDLRPAVKGAVIGMFKTITAARQMQERPCARDFLVLDQTSADKLGDGQIVLASPAVTKSDAELALEAVKACDGNLVGAVKTITGGVDLDADLDAGINVTE
jgi:hypothetical protein